MANPGGYLYRVAQSSARRYRRWGRRTTFPPEITSHERLVEPGPAAALAGLGDNQRVAVLLVHAHGYSHAEVAELTGMTPDAVRNHVHRGLKRLRATLEVT
jgi:DNA-directed RNA polymerase specialized sigma24 family protein